MSGPSRFRFAGFWRRSDAMLIKEFIQLGATACRSA